MRYDTMMDKYQITLSSGQVTHQTFPRILIQEAHSDIECSTTPALQTVRVGEGIACLLCDVDHIDRPQPRREQRLVSITPCCVHNEDTRVFANRLGKGLGTMLNDDVTPSSLAGNDGIERGSVGVVAILEGRNDDLIFKTWFATLSFDGTAIDGKISEVSEEFLGPVLTLDKFEKLGGIVDKLLTGNVNKYEIREKGGVTYCCPGLSADEDVMGEQSEKEGNIGLQKQVSIVRYNNNIVVPYLYATNTELDKSSEHLSASNLVSGTADCNLD